MTVRKTKLIDVPADQIEDEDDLIASIAEFEARVEPDVARLADEPMFSALLRDAVRKTNPDDQVLLDYVDNVAQPLSLELALKLAKGGDEFLNARRAEGKSEAALARYRHDQSLRAHLVNGLLPVAHIARLLKKWGAPRLRHFDETTYRLFCAGFTLHDWLKLPEVDDWLAREGLSHASISPAQHLQFIEAIFRQWLARLKLDRFLEPVGGAEVWLHDLIYLAANTQVRWGTMLNLSQLPGIKLEGRPRQLATDLCTLADRIAYIAKTPRAVVVESGIVDLINNLSDGKARLVYHHVAENRGLLTNFIHNAALNRLAHAGRVPLLYAPSGVVYLERTQDGQPGGQLLFDIQAVAEETVNEIRRACASRISLDFTGLSRDGKGLKTAPYYDLHFSAAEQIRLMARGVFRMIPETKKSSAQGRYDNLRAKGMAPADVDLNLPADIRVDQLAEFCAISVALASSAAPGLDLVDLVLRVMDISTERANFDAINTAKGGGGVPYAWYYVAGAYLGRGQGLGCSPDELRAEVEKIAGILAQAVHRQQQTDLDGWDDLRVYVRRVLSVGPHSAAGQGDDVRQTAARELARYMASKKRGREAAQVCSLCSSAYQVNPQREAGLLFAPQVYTNKQPLHGSKATRNICRICESEMMLRQILMNHGGALGGRFEGRRVRYLYFYPTYFFTPETLAQLRSVYRELRRVSFTALRKALLDENNGRARLNVGIEDFQRLQPFILEARNDGPDTPDRLFRFHFPELQPVAFYFLGLPPPGRDAKDAEAWVNPAFLSLVLPLALDVKVVASESPMPLLVEADELDESVFLDAPHDFVKDLLGRERISLEGLLPRIQALTAAYLIHIDGNAHTGAGGFDYRWHALPPVARNLAADPLWAFAYLKKWQRANKADTLPVDKAQFYLQYVSILCDLKGNDAMSHARTLTEYYMQFYRAERWNSNSILRPIMVAARAILEADPRLFGDRQSLTEAVYGEMDAFMKRVQSGKADGRLPAGSNWQSREAAMRKFTEYFVGDVYYDALRADKSALRGKQLNLIKNACEVIYRDKTVQEKQSGQLKDNGQDLE